MARTDIKELDLFIENKMKALKMPGLTVAIRGPEGVIFEKGYGVRDRETPVWPWVANGSAGFGTTAPTTSSC